MHVDPGIGPAEFGAAIAGLVYGGARLFGRFRNGKQLSVQAELAEMRVQLSTLSAKVDLILSSMSLRLKD